VKRFKPCTVSEVAFGKTPDPQCLRFCRVLGDFPNTFAVIESTANGVAVTFMIYGSVQNKGKHLGFPFFLRGGNWKNIKCL